MKKKLAKAWKKAKSKRGFTLIELIVCVTLLGVLMALIIPTYIKQIDSARMKAAEAECAGCVTAAITELSTGSTLTTISEDDVALAATPGKAKQAPQPEEDKVTVQVEAGTRSWDDFEAEAQVKGDITDIRYEGTTLTRLVYVTKSGRYTVTYENGGYTAVKNK